VKEIDMKNLGGDSHKSTIITTVEDW